VSGKFLINAMAFVHADHGRGGLYMTAVQHPAHFFVIDKK